jgi:hypothetical protein
MRCIEIERGWVNLDRQLLPSLERSGECFWEHQASLIVDSGSDARHE